MEQPRYEQVIKDKAIQAEINRVADSIDGLDRQGQNARAIRFYRPNPRGFSNGHALMNKLPYTARLSRNVLTSWVVTVAGFAGAVTYKQYKEGYWFSGRRPE